MLAFNTSDVRVASFINDSPHVVVLVSRGYLPEAILKAILQAVGSGENCQL
jgi:predicted HAD superfamily hydrolase